MPVRPVVTLFGALVSMVSSSVAARVVAYIVSIWILPGGSGTAIIVQVLVSSEQTLVALTTVALNKRKKV